MLSLRSLSVGLLLTFAIAFSGNLKNHAGETDRRSFLRNSVAVGGLALGGTLPSSRVLAVQDGTGEAIEVYLGVGCYWHIQNSFIKAERELLGRDDRHLTARTGYAGGNKVGSEGRVCYHNFQGLSDYGKLGHAEVVGLKLPSEDSIVSFAKVYFDLFDEKTKDRVDPQDKGGEYRSLIGLPGGKSHATFSKIEEAASAKGFKLEAGKGNDPDTLGKQLVYVYDTRQYPFHQAEVYMQYHDDFQSPPYGSDYNNLVELALEDGRVLGQGCPDSK